MQYRNTEKRSRRNELPWFHNRLGRDVSGFFTGQLNEQELNSISDDEEKFKKLIEQWLK